jgi:glycosyltransferase involved in cell wall biosynthesis
MSVRARADGQLRVAVVIPCHNDGGTLVEALESVRAQEPCELVVIDDGSTEPETAELLHELERDDVRIVRQENRGPGAARNAGVDVTRAPYVFPLDADDVLCPGSLTALADLLDADPELALAWGNTRMFGDARHLSRKARTLDPWLMSHANALPTGTMIRRRALAEAGGWSVDVGYEDWDLWMTLAELGWRGRHAGRVVARHRVRSRSRFSADFERHDEIVSELRRRHPRLFMLRREAWKRSTAPWRTRLLLPLVARVPASPRTRLRLHALVLDPAATAEVLLRKGIGDRAQ